MIAFGTVCGMFGNQITFELDRRPEDEELQSLEGKTLEITAREKKERRTLDANSYYWVLVGKLAAKLRTSTTELHNVLLRQYGQPMLIDDQKAYFVIPDTPEAERKALMSDTFHIKPTSEVKIDRQGKGWRTYFLLRGSHEYNTTEFSRLLDATIEECKGQGIETLPPDEIERMLVLYGQKHHAKGE